MYEKHLPVGDFFVHVTDGATFFSRKISEAGSRKFQFDGIEIIRDHMYITVTDADLQTKPKLLKLLIYNYMWPHNINSMFRTLLFKTKEFLKKISIYKLLLIISIPLAFCIYFHFKYYTYFKIDRLPPSNQSCTQYYQTSEGCGLNKLGESIKDLNIGQSTIPLTKLLTFNFCIEDNAKVPADIFNNITDQNLMLDATKIYTSINTYIHFSSNDREINLETSSGSEKCVMLSIDQVKNIESIFYRHEAGYTDKLIGKYSKDQLDLIPRNPNGINMLVNNSKIYLSVNFYSLITTFVVFLAAWFGLIKLLLSIYEFIKKG